MAKSGDKSERACAVLDQPQRLEARQMQYKSRSLQIPGDCLLSSRRGLVEDDTAALRFDSSLPSGAPTLHMRKRRPARKVSSSVDRFIMLAPFLINTDSS